MADYYPLLARALDALPDRTPALRKAVYDRARHALISQLRSLDPPLSEVDIDLERRALDAAIERLEVDHGGLPAPANDAALAGSEAFPSPAPAEPARPAPAPVEPALPPANPPFEARYEPPVITPEPEAEPREAAIPIAPPRTGASQPVAPDVSEPAVLPPPVDDPEIAAAVADAGNGRQRPRIEVVPPRAGRSRLLRNVFVGGILAAVIAMIAVAAFLLRDRPQGLPSSGTETADTQQPETETKFGDRVGGEAAPAPRVAPRSDSPAPPRAVSPSTEPTVSVAQRAELIEEVPGGDNAQPTLLPGRVTWKLDTVNGDQGQPLQNAVVATITIPDAGLTLTMTLQRNLDSTLPASHTVNLTFSQTGGGRTIQDVGLLQAKDDQNARGSPVSGLPVRVRDNLFLIGLSSLPNDIERNTDLLLHKNWFDLALRYTSGKRAVLTFEKGSTGAQVMQNAFAAWQ
ncbi:MAG: histidine kinase [Parafilimonas terrae]|nr:histidine kinase [Parafilimonas terrae]